MSSLKALVNDMFWSTTVLWTNQSTVSYEKIIVFFLCHPCSKYSC